MTNKRMNKTAPRKKSDRTPWDHVIAKPGDLTLITGNVGPWTELGLGEVTEVDAEGLVVCWRPAGQEESVPIPTYPPFKRQVQIGPADEVDVQKILAQAAETPVRFMDEAVQLVKAHRLPDEEPVKVADCTPQTLTAAGVIDTRDLPDHPAGDGPGYLTQDGRELSDGDTVALDRRGAGR